MIQRTQLVRPAALPSELLRSAQERRPDVLLPRLSRRRRSRFRSVWISDLHLGSPGCKAAELLAFLGAIEPERLYLVGDIIDGWSLERQHHWPEDHERVLRRFFGLAGRGADVTYITGNHDEELRECGDLGLGRLRLRDHALHVTADGRRLVVLHGDQFDAVTTRVRWLAELGDRAYSVALAVNSVVNRATARVGLREVSFSLYLKQSVKAAVGRVNGWEASVAAETARHGAQGLVCGHIHKPELSSLAGGLYLNDGDWVESCTALVELHDGSLELVHWSDAQHSLKPVQAVAA